MCIHELFTSPFYTSALDMFGEAFVPPLSSVYHLNCLVIEDTIQYVFDSKLYHVHHESRVSLP